MLHTIRVYESAEMKGQPVKVLRIPDTLVSDVLAMLMKEGFCFFSVQ